MRSSSESDWNYRAFASGVSSARSCEMPYAISLFYTAQERLTMPAKSAGRGEVGADR